MYSYYFKSIYRNDGNKLFLSFFKLVQKANTFQQCIFSTATIFYLEGRSRKSPVTLLSMQYLSKSLHRK